jgi:hypothetical protein
MRMSWRLLSLICGGMEDLAILDGMRSFFGTLGWDLRLLRHTWVQFDASLVHLLMFGGRCLWWAILWHTKLTAHLLSAWYNFVVSKFKANRQSRLNSSKFLRSNQDHWQHFSRSLPHKSISSSFPSTFLGRINFNPSIKHFQVNQVFNFKLNKVAESNKIFHFKFPFSHTNSLETHDKSNKGQIVPLKSV